MRAKRHAAGFTLLELLAVVVVIMMLMGLLLPAVLKSKKGMMERKAQVDAMALNNAVESYRAFYKEFPAPRGDLSGGRDVTYGGGSSGNVVLLEKLFDPPTTGGRQSPPFLDRSDFTYDSDGNAINLWRKPYRITLDLDYDGRVGGSSKQISVGYDRD